MNEILCSLHNYTKFSGFSNSFYDMAQAGLDCGLDVVIPETINNVPVLAVGAGSFDGYELTSLILPNNLLIINSEAFRYHSFASVVIPSNVRTIQSYAFATGDPAYVNFSLEMSRVYLENVINKTGRAFDWGGIVVSGNFRGAPFVSGTLNYGTGELVVTAQ